MVSADPADQRRLGEIFAHGIVEPEAGVPQRMADAAEHVVKQRPGEAEQQQLGR